MTSCTLTQRFISAPFGVQGSKMTWFRKGSAHGLLTVSRAVGEACGWNDVCAGRGMVGEGWGTRGLFLVPDSERAWLPLPFGFWGPVWAQSTVRIVPQFCFIQASLAKGVLSKPSAAGGGLFWCSWAVTSPAEKIHPALLQSSF